MTDQVCFLFFLQQHRVDDMNCQELSDAPEGKEDCDIPCPNDCILSPWTAWSTCPSVCQEGYSQPAIRRRERTVLAQAGIGNIENLTDVSIDNYGGFWNSIWPSTSLQAI